ncbi:MAG: iron ABC transporter permease [Candidatus Hydrogenedentes bacterium]|nr:iron ABC transporter permease [Candidatus Hydrogenedentota bacterium]
MVNRSNGEKLCGAVAVTLFCLMAIVPLGYMVVRSVYGNDGVSFAAYREVLNDSRQWGLMLRSLRVAAGTALAATLLGVPAGFALEYLRVPARRALAFVFAVPVLVPPYIWTVAWIDLFGKQGPLGSVMDIYSVSGVIFVLATAWYPLVALMTALAIRRLDSRAEEAARMAVSPVRTFLGVTVPLVLPGVVAGSGFVFLLALVNFGVPSLLQVNVYPVEIYARFNAFHDFAGATAAALPMVAIVTVLLGLMAAFLKNRYVMPTTVHDRQARGRSLLRYVAAVYLWTIAAGSAGIPALALIRSSMPVTSYVHAWQTAHSELIQSLVLAAITATVLVILGFALAYRIQSGRGVARFIMRAGVLAPFAVSGPVLGIGSILLWNRPGPAGMIYGSALIVVISVAARFMFFAEEGFSAAFRSVHPELEEAAIVAGVPWWSRVGRVVAPMVYPTFVAVWGLSFVLALQELAVTVLVSPPGLTTLPVRLFTLMHYGPNSLVSALCVLMTVVMLAGAAVPALIYIRVERGRHVRR